MDAALITQLGPEDLRKALPGFLSGYIADPEVAARNRARMEAMVARFSAEDLASLHASLASLGDERRVYRAHARAGEVARAWMRDLVLEDRLEGVAHLGAAVEAGPTVVVANHVSYVDTSATDGVLAWAGHADLADRIVTAAGPKVYSDLFRRVAAAALNTLPVPQSTSFGHTAPLPPRELARQAGESLEAARDALRQGLAFQIYPEGSRTRTGRLQPFLKATWRYLDAPVRHVVPLAILGTREIFPVGARQLTPGPVTLCFGPPIEVAGSGGPREALARAHAALAALLPDSRKPNPDEPALR